jgi:WD40 repeat protein
MVFALAALPDGRLASAGSRVLLWHLPARAHTALPVEGGVYSLCVLEGGLLALGCYGGVVQLWEVGAAAGWGGGGGAGGGAVPTPRRAGALELQGQAARRAPSAAVHALAALARGRLAAAASDAVRLWCVGSRACLAVLRGHSASVEARAALPGGRLASGSSGDDGVVCVWEVGGFWGAHEGSATAPSTTGPRCATCSARTLGPCAASGEHFCFLCRHFFAPQRRA